MRIWFRHITKAFESIRLSWALHFLTMSTISAALVLVGLYGMGLYNISSLGQQWSKISNLTVYLDENLESQAWETTAAMLRMFPEIQSTKVVTPSEAMDEFLHLGHEAQSMVVGLDVSIFPPAIEIQFESGLAQTKRFEILKKQILFIPGVSQLDYGQNEYEQLTFVIRLLQYLGLGAGLLVTLAVIFIVSNTIKLIIYSRRDEIEVLQLVGATNGFIRAPFLVEAVIWGGVAGGMAAVFLWGLDVAFAESISFNMAKYVGDVTIYLFALPLVVVLPVLGLFLSLSGSIVAVGRFFRQ